MSRAINLSVTEADVTKMCLKHKADISCIEALPSGGTRVVLRTGEDAVTLRRVFGSKVITGPVQRTETFMRRR